jgi:hypothetical protein
LINIRGSFRLRVKFRISSKEDKLKFNYCFEI